MESTNDSSFGCFKSSLFNTIPKSKSSNNHKSPPVDNSIKLNWDTKSARGYLREAIQSLSDRGLKLAARWAAEQLNGLKTSENDDTTRNHTIDRAHNDNVKPSDLELYAKSIMELGEYYRAASILSMNQAEEQAFDVTGVRRRVTSKGGDVTVLAPRADLSPYGIYLRAYALFMAGERRKEEEILELRYVVSFACNVKIEVYRHFFKYIFYFRTCKGIL